MTVELVALPGIPSVRRGAELAALTRKDPRLVELILREWSRSQASSQVRIGCRRPCIASSKRCPIRSNVSSASRRATN